MPAREETTPTEVRRTIAVQIALTAVFLLVVFVLLDRLDSDAPPIWLIAVLLLIVVAGAVLAERSWLTVKPLAPDAHDREREALDVYVSQTLRKFAYCEGAVLVCVILAFAVDHAAWPIVIGALPGLAVLAFETWPSPRNLSLIEAMLDADGGSSRLMERFDTARLGDDA
ncbi:hypothetical protein [Aeromicrobium sp. CF3.5]|uniref:hypothetical protein n=1 Tax=Aeromicrobium sp. CF3.5 TaxID=3373078 RepID=UPI003EE533DB